MFHPGELDQLITIRKVTIVDDGTGGTNEEVEVKAENLWAKVRPLSGAEVARNSGVSATSLATFIIRYRDNIETDDEILWNGQTFNITYIPTVSARELYLAIQAERVA